MQTKTGAGSRGARRTIPHVVPQRERLRPATSGTVFNLLGQQEALKVGTFGEPSVLHHGRRAHSGAWNHSNAQDPSTERARPQRGQQGRSDMSRESFEQQYTRQAIARERNQEHVALSKTVSKVLELV